MMPASRSSSPAVRPAPSDGTVRTDGGSDTGQLQRQRRIGLRAYRRSAIRILALGPTPAVRRKERPTYETGVLDPSAATAEDRVAAGTHEAGRDDQDETEDDLALKQLNDAGNGEDNGNDPQEEVHGG